MNVLRVPVRIGDRDRTSFWVRNAPLPANFEAVTIGRLVLVGRSMAMTEELIAHESEHVRQYAEMGIVGFVRRYVSEYRRGRAGGLTRDEAYQAISLERDAYRVGRETLRSRY